MPSPSTTRPRSTISASAAAALVAGWVVASRFGLLAASLGGRLRVGRLHRGLAGLQSFDPNVTLAVQQRSPARVVAVFWRVTAAMFAGWILGTVVGAALGNAIGDADRLGLDALFPAALLAIIGNLLRRRDGATAAVLGGIGSIPGAVLGGLLLGVTEAITAGYFSSEYKDVVAFSLLILILLFRPSGILGRPEVEKV